MIIQPGGELLSKRWAAVIFALNTAMYIICITHLHCKLFAIYTTFIVHYFHDTWHCTLCTLYSAVIHRYLHYTRQTSPVLPLKSRLWVVLPPPHAPPPAPPAPCSIKFKILFSTCPHCVYWYDVGPGTFHLSNIAFLHFLWNVIYPVHTAQLWDR